MPTPEKIKANREEMNKGADIAVDTMSIESDDDDMKGDAVQTLETLFSLPDVTDRRFWDTEIEGESKLWKVWEGSVEVKDPFTKETMWGDGAETLHTLTSVGRSILLSEGLGKATPNQWLSLFEHCLDAEGKQDEKHEQLMALMTKWTMTDPLTVFELNDKGRGVVRRGHQKR